MPSYYEFKLPAKIPSGDGPLEHIPHELEALGSVRPLLLSDEGLVKAGAVSNSLLYRKDRSLKRRLRIAKNQLGHYYKFKTYYHRPE